MISEQCLENEWVEHLRASDTSLQKVDPGQLEVAIRALDVLEEPCPITNLVEKPVTTRFLEVEEEVRVRLPSVNALLGDKLTAFAPPTVGGKLTEATAQQVAKQMFDVGELFLAADDFQAVKNAYRENQAAEASYHEEPPTFEESLKDTREAAYEFCHHGLKKDPNRNPEDRALLLKGIGQMQGLLVGTRFNTVEARIHAARAARAADAILQDLSFKMDALHYLSERDLEQLRDWRFSPEHAVLQRLRAQPEALYHWKHILGGIDGECRFNS